MLSDEDYRKLFPSLNEFCSSDSLKLIKWLRENNYTDFGWLSKPYVSYYCPNINFVFDGLREVVYHLPEFDDKIDMLVTRMAMKAFKLRISSEIGHHVDKMHEFSDYRTIDPKVRGRVMVWELSHLVMKVISKTPLPPEIMGDMTDWGCARDIVADELCRAYQEYLERTDETT